MPVVIPLPYNTSFEISVNVNADWRQSVVIVDMLTFQVYGPYGGSGRGEVGKFQIQIPAGTDPLGYRFRITVMHWHPRVSGPAESEYYVSPQSGRPLYLSVQTEDFPESRPDVDWNDCVVNFKML